MYKNKEKAEEIRALSDLLLEASQGQINDWIKHQKAIELIYKRLEKRFQKNPDIQDTIHNLFVDDLPQILCDFSICSALEFYIARAGYIQNKRTFSKKKVVISLECISEPLYEKQETPLATDWSQLRQKWKELRPKGDRLFNSICFLFTHKIRGKYVLPASPKQVFALKEPVLQKYIWEGCQHVTGNCPYIHKCNVTKSCVFGKKYTRDIFRRVSGLIEIDDITIED